jgi:6-phosphogluconolactonase
MLSEGCSGPASEQKADISANDNAATEMILFVGTYTEKEAHVDGQAAGVYVYRLDPTTGALTYLSTSERVINPSYVAVHPNKQFLYAVNETGGEGQDISGAVSAFKIDKKTSALSLINQVSSAGDWPCYISVDHTGKFVLVANYGGSVAMMPLNEDGSVGEAVSAIEHRGSGPTNRQQGPHAHMIIPGLDNELAYAVDLGTDKVITYKMDLRAAALTAISEATELTPGAGPRHIAFHPKQKTAYVVNELNSTIECFNINESGGLERFQIISTLPEGSADEGFCADIQFHPSGNFLYASNRGEVNNIVIYEVSKADGSLKQLGHQSTYGKAPRSFVIDPSGSFLIVANQDTGDVYTFKLDKNTGLPIDNPVKTEIPTPVCLKFL